MEDARDAEAHIAPDQESDALKAPCDGHAAPAEPEATAPGPPTDDSAPRAAVEHPAAEGDAPAGAAVADESPRARIYGQREGAVSGLSAVLAAVQHFWDSGAARLHRP